MEFSESECNTLSNALMIASERFREDIKELEASDLDPILKARLIAQFNSQILGNTKLLEKLAW